MSDQEDDKKLPDEEKSSSDDINQSSVEKNNQPDLKFYSNFYFSKFFGSRLLGIIHLVSLILL